MLFMQRRLQLSVELEALLWQFVVCIASDAAGAESERKREKERVRQAVRHGVVSGLPKGRQQHSTRNKTRLARVRMLISALKHKLR